MTYSVKEIFYTLQGEGGQAGTPAVFCRFAGCNLWTGREQDRAQAIAAAPTTELPTVPAWDDSRVTDADESVVISHNWDELRRFMWDYVGIVRTNKRLERAAHRIAMLQGEIQEFYAHFHVTRDLLELRNLVQVADLIVKSAQLRRESRGLHFSRDYPEMAAPAAPTLLVPPVAR